MTNIKYSKRFKLRNGERVDFCPECEYRITDTVNNSDSVYCPKCGQQIQLFKPALCSEDCEFLIRQKLTGKLFCKAFKDGEKELRRDIERVVKEYSRRFNVWEVARGLNKTKHPAVFPERLANDHILSWSNKGDVVLDPFCGSGTTAKMAMLTGRKFIGFEISAEYCDIAEKRIASVGKDIPLFEAD